MFRKNVKKLKVTCDCKKDSRKNNDGLAMHGTLNYWHKHTKSSDKKVKINRSGIAVNTITDQNKNECQNNKIMQPLTL